MEQNEGFLKNVGRAFAKASKGSGYKDPITELNEEQKKKIKQQRNKSSWTQTKAGIITQTNVRLVNYYNN